jgi:hypothetical protein
VRHHLRDVHLAPLAFCGRLKRVNPRNYFVDCFSLEKVLHTDPAKAMIVKNHSTIDAQDLD